MFKERPNHLTEYEYKQQLALKKKKENDLKRQNERVFFLHKQDIIKQARDLQRQKAYDFFKKSKLVQRWIAYMY
jgi:type IV secretory pathway VirD2 relaxase